MDALSIAVNKLKQDQFSFADKPMQVLNQTLEEFKDFVIYLTKKPNGFFEKAINFFKSASDLENLANFDSRLTRALSDL
jgi:hypothetical protein